MRAREASTLREPAPELDAQPCDLDRQPARLDELRQQILLLGAGWFVEDQPHGRARSLDRRAPAGIIRRVGDGHSARVDVELALRHEEAQLELRVADELAQQPLDRLRRVILVDATIIRALLVPATVSPFGRWNWVLPAGMARLLRVGPSQRELALAAVDPLRQGGSTGKR